MEDVPLPSRNLITISDYEQYSIRGNLLVLNISTESLSQETIRLLNSYRGNITIIPTNYDYKILNKLLYDCSKMTATEKMNSMYEWVQNNFEYDMSLIQADGNYKDGIDRSLGSDPIKVFARGKGGCIGRSRLLTIFLNNPYMNVECYTVDGMMGNLQHEWNEFIDENGQVWEYDLSYRRANA